MTGNVQTSVVETHIPARLVRLPMPRPSTGGIPTTWVSVPR